jgi:hypothetical protein
VISNILKAWIIEVQMKKTEVDPACPAKLSLVDMNIKS